MFLLGVDGEGHLILLRPPAMYSNPGISCLRSIYQFQVTLKPSKLKVKYIKVNLLDGYNWILETVESDYKAAW